MPDRYSIQCVGPHTITQVMGNDEQPKPLEIERVKCLFDYNPSARNEAERYKRNADFANHHWIFNRKGNYVAPVFRYEYSSDSEEFPQLPLLEITARSKNPGNAQEHKIVTTLLHPMMVGLNNIIPACLLQPENDVLLIDGPGKVLTVKSVEVPKVFGLTLAKLAPTDDLEQAMNNLEGELPLGNGNWDKFDLDVFNHIIYTGNFFSGTLPVQLKLLEKIKSGTELESIRIDGG